MGILIKVICGIFGWLGFLLFVGSLSVLFTDAFM